MPDATVTSCPLTPDPLTPADSWTSASRTSISPQLTRASLSDLHPFTTYSLRLFTLNTVGASPASNTLTVTTGEEGNRHTT